MLTLMYHNVLLRAAHDLPVAAGQTTVEGFERQIARLKPHLLHPETLRRALQRNRLPHGVLITFDDGAAGVAEAARILTRAGAAAVAFVCPGTLRRGLWFYRLALTSPEERRRTYDLLFDLLFPLPHATREARLRELLSVLDAADANEIPELATLDEEGLRDVTRSGSLYLANHTWSHPNLSALASAEIEQETAQAAEWLRKSGLPSLPWFAFPGGAYNSEACRVVARHATLMFGACPREFHPAVLPRVGIYGSDANSWRFTLKTALEGWLPRRLGRRTVYADRVRPSQRVPLPALAERESA